jgi:glycosyltransferase involved in cell wall biosynthesis
MNLIYVGRLDPEKWIESLLYAIKDLIRQQYEFHIHIYGQWSYLSQTTLLADTYPRRITYHGRQHKRDIIWQRRCSDFFIMPSSFLETFGLTACESLLCWVPVIANKKWWLIPFVHDTLDIQQALWDNDAEKLYNIISYLINNNISSTTYHSLIETTKKIYTSTKWIDSIQKIIQKKKKILMVSDFINYNWGGIETHIHDAATLLEHHDHTVDIYWHQAPTGRRSTGTKLLWMCLSICNIPDYIQIYRIISKKTIWLIRRHSISRSIWWLPIWLSSTTDQIITHHELGLFHPFPSQTTQESQIPAARSLSAFIKAGQTNNFIKKMAIAGKYIMIRCIHKQLQKKIKTHIVPSERMIPMVRQRHPQADIICIGHFVSHK